MLFLHFFNTIYRQKNYYKIYSKKTLKNNNNSTENAYITLKNQDSKTLR